MFASLTRRKSHRAISFDALESRMVLSASAMEFPHAEVHTQQIHAEAKADPPVKGSLKGDIALQGNQELVLSHMHGKLGKAQLTGTGSGVILANRFEGGTLQLSSAKGTLTFDLYAGPVTNATGSKPSVKAVAIISDATGSYAGNDDAVVGSAGTVTLSWKQTKVKVKESTHISAWNKGEVSAQSTGLVHYDYSVVLDSLAALVNVNSFDSLAFISLNG